MNQKAHRLRWALFFGCSSELNSDIVNAGTVRYDSVSGYIQYTDDEGQTWVDLINVNTPIQRLPSLTSNNSSPLGVASGVGSNFAETDIYKLIGDSSPSTSAGFSSSNNYVQFTFTNDIYIKYMTTYINCLDGTDADAVITIDWSNDGGTIWNLGSRLAVRTATPTLVTQNVNAVVNAIRIRKPESTWYRTGVKQFKAWN